MRIPALILWGLLSAAGATAQSLEVVGTLAAGCLGSDGSMCGGGKAPLVGAHASIWAANRVELAARVARVGMEDYSYKSYLFGETPEIAVTNRSRTFVSFLFVYHFLEGRAVRPMLGLGSGWYSDARRVACQPAGCESQLPFGPERGSFRDWDIDAIFVVGLSGVVRDRWVWRGGWQSHRFANDENSTQEFFVGLGYRFGRR